MSPAAAPSMEEKGRGVVSLAREDASGAVTARAVVLLREIDEQIEAATGGEASLDDVVKRLCSERGVVSGERFRRIAIFHPINPRQDRAFLHSICANTELPITRLIIKRAITGNIHRVIREALNSNFAFDTPNPNNNAETDGFY